MYLTTPQHELDVTVGNFKTKFSSIKFSIFFSLTSCHTAVMEPVHPYNLSIAGGE